jgi:hypothetical protein
LIVQIVLGTGFGKPGYTKNRFQIQTIFKPVLSQKGFKLLQVVLNYFQGIKKTKTGLKLFFLANTGLRSKQSNSLAFSAITRSYRKECKTVLPVNSLTPGCDLGSITRFT